MMLAQHFLDIQQPHKALEHLTKNPQLEDPDYWRLLGRTHYLLDHDAEASKAFREGLKLEPDNPALRYGLLLNHYWFGRYDAALKEIDALLTLYPESAVYLARKALILGQQGNYKEAATYLTKAREMDPEHALVQEAAMLLRYWEDQAALKHAGVKENLEETVQHAKTILKTNPENAFAHYVLGKSLLRQGGPNRIRQALHHFSQAASFSPDDVRYTKTVRDTRWMFLPLFRYLPTAQHLPPIWTGIAILFVISLSLGISATRAWLPRFAFTSLLVLQNGLLLYLIIYSGFLPLLIVNYQDIRYRGLVPWLKDVYRKWRNA
jgi:tetratricopeptide (TPR) repeat protein